VAGARQFPGALVIEWGHELRFVAAQKDDDAGSLGVGADRQPKTRTGILMFGNRNVLFLVIGALVVLVGVLGYNLYQSQKQPEGLQINVGPNGVKIQGK
jgi:hypothetical protein